ncbi:MAG: DUF3048 domain-containing protein [Clostridia bacterium]|nr:DUF3048 domain-containing protein [Clostridia bacterium]
MKEHKKDSRLLRILALLAMMVLLFSSVGCEYVFGLGTGTDAPESGGEDIPGSADETTAPTPETTEPGVTEDPSGNITSAPEETTRAPETNEQGQIITYIDPLTGLRQLYDSSSVRPVSLVYDNVSVAAPQSGISKSDILIEMMVEGGISRLVGITNDYVGADGEPTLDVFGPIRSTRPYMISLSQAFDSLMVGGGGSPQAYETIKNLGLQYVDGVNDRYAMQGFYRDVERYKNDGWEHSLMVHGKGIAKIAEFNNYPLTAQTSNAFNFIEEGKSMYLSGGSATHVILKYSLYQQVQLVYSSQTGTYYRYQHGDVPHLDAENGEQLNFRNVLILFAQTNNIEGDAEGRLNVQTTGTGEGYYISDGRYVPIRWSRASDTSELSITGMSGEQLTINRGKTFISVVNSSLKGTSSIELNFKIGN